MKTSHRLNWIIALLGAWEIVSPFILGYTSHVSAAWSSVLFGIVVLLISVWSAISHYAETNRGLDWVNVAIGAWLIISPFTLGYTTFVAAMWSNIVTGILVFVLSGLAAVSVRTRKMTQTFRDNPE
jgi:hypothetical protein